ncbi:hypothetical protein F5Y15DRAFT_278486 [Xylariaceae sp. FL0016]|nr:hypothetical protein F5Y15DRAFT_278486 [Xylariaceae sp. FL0016]
MSSLRTLVRARAPLFSSVSARATNISSIRRLHTSSAVRAPYKDDQDREALNPKAQEYAKSGSDDAAAANEDAAFNPNKTSPEAAKRTAGQGNDGNPLETSPANKDVAKGGAGKEEDRPHGGQTKQSGGGSGPKDGKAV